jgi:hypothetical protein
MEITLYAPGKLLDGRGLGESRRAFHQQMAVSQQRYQQVLYQGVLPDDAALQFPAQLVEGCLCRGGERVLRPNYRLCRHPLPRFGYLIGVTVAATEVHCHSVRATAPECDPVPQGKFSTGNGLQAQP